MVLQLTLEEKASDVWPRGAAVLQDAEAAAAASDIEGGADTVKAVATVLGKHPLSLDEVGGTKKHA